MNMADFVACLTIEERAQLLLALTTSKDPWATSAEMLIARQQGKIYAIKAYRNRTGLALKECKDAIERALI